MRRSILALFLLSACRLPGATPEATVARPLDRPEWVGRKTFEEDGVLYGVGEAKVESKGCWEPALLIGAAKNRARAALAPEVERAPDDQRQVRLATLQRSEPVSGWFDGEGTVYLLVGIPTSSTADAGRMQAGLRPMELADRLKAHNLERLNRTGACQDPHQRAELPCCGPVKTFCSDPTRYSVKGSNGVCGCGSGPPCLYDFTCQDRQGKKQCRCSGKKCPCEGLACDPGETCQDQRCY